MSSRPVTLRERPGERRDKEIKGFLKERRRGDIMSFLPIEAALQILGNLYDPVDLANCSKVSRNWRFLANDNALWKEFIEDKEVVIPPDKNVKEFIAEQCPVPGAIFCRSHAEAIKKLEAFFRNLPYDLWGRFIVVSSQLDEQIAFELKVGGENSDHLEPVMTIPMMTKTCFLIRSKVAHGHFEEMHLPRRFSNGLSRAIFNSHCLVGSSSDFSTERDKHYDKAFEIINEKLGEKGKWRRWELSRNRMTRVVMGIALGVLAYLTMESYK
ncbi:MAG: hypothetical protein K1060chlam1_00224 [Candidatus Anoxychlamydiales bacterium]|nr:hypothetical protein [Candidatus Anoxychlamydiales bacterium]